MGVAKWGVPFLNGQTEKILYVESSAPSITLGDCIFSIELAGSSTPLFEFAITSIWAEREEVYYNRTSTPVPSILPNLRGYVERNLIPDARASDGSYYGHGSSNKPSIRGPFGYDSRSIDKFMSSRILHRFKIYPEVSLSEMNSACDCELYVDISRQLEADHTTTSQSWVYGNLSLSSQDKRIEEFPNYNDLPNDDTNNIDESLYGPRIYSWDRVSTNKFLVAPFSHPYSNEIAHRKYLNFNEFVRFDFDVKPSGNIVAGSACSLPSQWSSLSSFETRAIPGGTVAAGGFNGLPTFIGELEQTEGVGVNATLPLRYNVANPLVNIGNGNCAATVEALVAPKTIALAYSKFEDIWTMEINGNISQNLVEFNTLTNTYQYTEFEQGDRVFSLNIVPGSIDFEDLDGFFVTLLTPMSSFPNGLYLGHTPDLNFDVND